MYLRHATKWTKSGKRTYWTLVRSVRRGARVVQEVVASLGRLDPKEVREAAAIARHFLGAKADQPQLFEDTREIGPEHVELGRVRVERGRAFGAVWLGWLLWRALELDDFCNARLRRGREAVPWAEIASILAIARLCEPSSELHIAETWYQKCALADLIGIAPEQVHHTRLYQGLDRLVEAQGRAAATREGAHGRALLAGLRPDALRRDLDVLRGRVREQSDGAARLQP
jgi:hypothetical protein